MMILYDSAQHEWLAVAAYRAMAEAGDLELVFDREHRSLTAVLASLKDSGTLMEADARGAWFISWVVPAGAPLDGAMFALWVRRDKRRSPAALRAVDFAYEQALKVWPCVYGLTKQAGLHRQHLKAGYHYIGTLPSSSDGEDVLVYAMTRQSRADVKMLKYSRLRQLVHGEKVPTTATERRAL